MVPEPESYLTQEFISIGGTSHPSASAWDRSSGILAFGAGRVVALWNPDDSSSSVYATLKGHADKVNAVVFLPGRQKGDEIILSGSVDKTIKIWRRCSGPGYFELALSVERHSGSVISIDVVEESKSNIAKEYTITSASSDGSVKIWKLTGPPERTTITRPSGEAETVADEAAIQAPKIECLQEIITKPKYLPLAVAVAILPFSKGAMQGKILAIAGTSNAIAIYTTNGSNLSSQFSHVATLVGHENWVRSLAFTCEVAQEEESDHGTNSSDLILASGSQDKYIRLWRIHNGTQLPERASDPSHLDAVRSLSNKAHRFQVRGRTDDDPMEDYSITFEALLVGHDDWVYTVKWQSQEGAQPNNPLKLLSASADNSLSIWEPDSSTGIWTPVSRLGQISSLKGASTATGSTGGFWAGLWSPDGKSVVALAKTGSWRMWSYETASDSWLQSASISGHTRDVTAVVWEPEGQFFLSTSLDQTTRLFAQWHKQSKLSWHEFSRPQIHGYDINCVAFLGSNRFVSGAEEKLLRVFDEPKVTASLLESMCKVAAPLRDSMPDAAAVPALGLSNKVMDPLSDETVSDGLNDQVAVTSATSLTENGTETDQTSNRPPIEDELSRHTLWPESEKLYGHGFEISAVCSSHDGRIIATACRASSVDHAVIRLFSCPGWRQIKPPLKTHTLTINKLVFSGDDEFLLSVGRDRQWAIFKRVVSTDGEDINYTLHSVMPKAHSRIIWDGDWAPTFQTGVRMIATASRDKTVKIWRNSENESPQWTCTFTVKLADAVRAVAFFHNIVKLRNDINTIMLAVGLENGGLYIYHGGVNEQGKIDDWKVMSVAHPSTTPDKAITEISWRPNNSGKDGEFEIVVASEDSSVRIYSLRIR